MIGLALGLLLACEGTRNEVADPTGGGGADGGGPGGAGGGTGGSGGTGNGGRGGAGGSGHGGSGGAGGSAGAGCAIEVGTGATDIFEPLVAGQELQVATLGQGGEHIWGGIRVQGVEGDVFLDYDLLTPDGVEIAHNPACVPLLPSSLGDGYTERGGLVGYLPPGAADAFISGAEVILRMRVRSGASALACRPPDAPDCDVTAEIRVFATWTPVDGGGGSGGGCGAPGCR